MFNDRRIIRSLVLAGWSAILKLLGRTGLLSIRRTSGITRSASMIHGNIKRTFNIYLPAYSYNFQRPLVIVLHGRGANGRSMELLTRNGFNFLADRENFIVLYPDGVGMNWNDGRKDQKTNDRAHRENIDDTGFIAALIDLMVSDYGASPGLVFITGLSNGAIMAYRLACELSGRIAAISPVDGNIPRTLMMSCKPLEPVSVMVINNTLDPLVPYDGGEIHSGLLKQELGEVLSTSESVRYWVEKNRCSPVPVREEISNNQSDGIRVTKDTYLNQQDGYEVVLVTIHGGGHTWPGGIQYMPERIIGKTCMDFDAAVEIWAFFRKHMFRLQDALHD